MATLYRELISDETLPVGSRPTRITFGDSIAASRFGPVNELHYVGQVEDDDDEVEEVPLNERSLFRLNYLRWLDDSSFDSLPDMMRAHESYQAIVAQGQRALPFIAAELRKDPTFIFLALEDITGANPVPDEALGNLQATKDAWLAWLQS